MTLYALRSLAAGQFQMAKLDEDMNVAATYLLVAKGHSYSCNCLASYRGAKLKPCKHQRMMPYMMGAVNLPRFFDPDTGRWAGLIEVAPGMRQEHSDGEAAAAAALERDNMNLSGTGPIGAPEQVEPASGRLDAADKSSDDAQPEEAHMNGEPATATTDMVGQSRDASQPKRPMAPVSAAPVVVRRRI